VRGQGFATEGIPWCAGVALLPTGAEGIPPILMLFRPPISGSPSGGRECELGERVGSFIGVRHRRYATMGLAGNVRGGDWLMPRGGQENRKSVLLGRQRVAAYAGAAMLRVRCGTVDASEGRE